MTDSEFEEQLARFKTRTIVMRRELWGTFCIETEFAERLIAQLKELDKLTEWKQSILNALKDIPEWQAGEWAGDKEDWL